MLKLEAMRAESDWRKYREMQEELRALCVEIIGGCDEIPSYVKEMKEAVGLVEITTFDQSYLDFLDTQIQLGVRGADWSERLKVRRENLSKYAGRELASCRWKVGSHDFWIKIDPIAKAVVHWDAYGEWMK